MCVCVCVCVFVGGEEASTTIGSITHMHKSNVTSCIPSAVCQVLLLVAPMVLMLILPRLMKGMDPEQQKVNSKAI